MRSSAPPGFLAVILSGQFMANVDTSIVNVATPAIGTALHASGAELQLSVSSYVLAQAMLLVTGARLGTLFGYRRVFVIGLAIFTVASAACGLAPGAPALIVARAIQGAASALMVAQVVTGIQLNFSGRGLRRAIGTYTTTLSLSAVTGQILGGVLVWANLFGTGWRPIFLVNVPIGLALTFLAARILPPDVRGPGRAGDLDGIGVALLSVTVLAAIVPLTLGRETGWPVWNWCVLAASVPAGLAFVGWERRRIAAGSAPILDLGLLTTGTVGWGLAGLNFARACYFASLFVIALYLQAGLGESPLVSGLILVSWVALYGAAGYVYPRLPAAAARWAAPAGCLLVACAYAGIAGLTPAHPGAGPVLATLLGAGGFGFGTLSTAMMSNLTAAVPRSQAADLSGVLATCTPLAAVVGVATFGGFYLAMAVGGPAAATQAFSAVNVLYALALCIAAGCTARSIAYEIPSTRGPAARFDAAMRCARLRHTSTAAASTSNAPAAISTAKSCT